MTDTEKSVKPKNPKHILITGHSGTGKTTSLRNLRNPEGVLYINCESGKPIAFRGCKFIQETVDDPYEVQTLLNRARASKKIHTVIIDSISFLMMRYEAKYVKPNMGKKDAVFKAWSSYLDFFEKTMDDFIKGCGMNVIVLSHLMRIEDDDPNIDTRFIAACAGKLSKTITIEARFSTVWSVKEVPLSTLVIKDTEGDESKTLAEVAEDNPLLNITEDERLNGRKHVFQTRPIHSTVGEIIKTPMGTFDVKQSMVDNDIQLLFDHIDETE